ncbi:pyridoxamine 5'-phosphate oxidase family protein [Hydrogenobacter hydrogenophilus]|uniref:Pyridoxamine 5'-phosphate oxidase n=1 Tax=Hydrogenobacter hydrogenophilus TaxID=35835 RepID=A0A285P5P0_9AQUI|nr:pyridoxamine 5'-phosphate oxidase family protein [Hydrogenobacter hydrogenophilus]SNZ16483.1 Pyridoxamine 5'-phosphate oxidase [Hydrogenobacter hydrogenophilus]
MLPTELVDLMNKLGVFPCVLGTTDKEGNIHMTFITWVYPKSERILRFALSSDSKSAKNLKETKRACFMFFLPEKALACYGSVQMILESIEEIKFPVSVFEMHIDRVENSLFPGATITGIIPFAHTGDLEKMAELDGIVLEAMRSA